MTVSIRLSSFGYPFQISCFSAAQTKLRARHYEEYKREKHHEIECFLPTTMGAWVNTTFVVLEAVTVAAVYERRQYNNL